MGVGAGQTHAGQVVGFADFTLLCSRYEHLPGKAESWVFVTEGHHRFLGQPFHNSISCPSFPFPVLKRKVKGHGAEYHASE